MLILFSIVIKKEKKKKKERENSFISKKNNLLTGFLIEIDQKEREKKKLVLFC